MSPLVPAPHAPPLSPPPSGAAREHAHLRLVDSDIAASPPSARAPIDPAIIAQAKRGDEQAFTQIVRWYHPRFVRFARHMLRNDAEADDVVQEAFIRVYRALSQYQEQARFESWLFRILANCCRTAATRHRAQQFRLVALDTKEAHNVYVTPDARNDAAWRSLLATALEQLPLEQREAFLLHYVEGHSYESMVEMTGAGESALKMRVKRACDRMRVLLGGEGDGGRNA